MSSHGTAIPSRPHERRSQLVLRVLLPAMVTLALVVWAASHPTIARPKSPPGAGYVLAGFTLGVLAIVYWFRSRYDVNTRSALTLPDPLSALYLAAVILVGVPVGVLLAAVAPLVEFAPSFFRKTERTEQIIRAVFLRSASGTVVTLCAGLVYLAVSHLMMHWLSLLRSHFIGAVAASLVMLAGMCISRALEEWPYSASFRQALVQYVRSPALRFQLMLLSIVPLLPLADVLDDVEAEFAWILFLVPLCAVYYLALVSVRLQQRTEQLQITVEQLGKSRRREAELSDYAALITRAQEDERRRLARELHDDTAQALIALSRGLDALASRQVDPPLSSLDTRFIGELGELATRTLDSVRRACQDLRPSVLDDLGLSAALESMAHGMTQRGIACTYRQVGESVPCPPEIEVTVYRIAQEACSNARQHANARHVAVELAYRADMLELQVTDDGSGFDYDAQLQAHSALPLDAPENRPGLGLLGMRERAALIRARLTVRSASGEGTSICLSVPLDAH